MNLDTMNENATRLRRTQRPKAAAATPRRLFSFAREPLRCLRSMAASHGARADALTALGRPGEALDSFERALALNPNSVEDLCNCGATLVELGRYDEALARFARALARAPDFMPAHYNRGNALGHLGRHD